MIIRDIFVTVILYKPYVVTTHLSRLNETDHMRVPTYGFDEE